MEIRKVNLEEKFKLFNDYWSPKLVGELNGQHVKLAKFKGRFVMHHHENEDELFFVTKGILHIELLDRTLEIKAGEFVIIPRGVQHKPYAEEEVEVMLFEPMSTINTGNKLNVRTVDHLDEI